MLQVDYPISVCALRLHTLIMECVFLGLEALTPVSCRLPVRRRWRGHPFPRMYLSFWCMTVAYGINLLWACF
jgi:hypothetical protein